MQRRRRRAATFAGIMLSLLMATRPSTSLPAAGVVLAGAGAARAAAIGAAIAYVAVLDWAYTAHFSPVYAYTGLIDLEPSRGAALAVAGLAAAPAAWLPISARRPSTIVLWALYLVGYVPTAMVPLYLTGDLDAVLPFEAGLVSSMAILA